jgi:hypothetical protein
LEALLRSCRPLKIEDNTLQIEAFYKFHKERLEQVKNRRILEKVLNEITGVPLKVRTLLGKKEKKDAPSQDSPVKKPSGQGFDDVENEAVEVFNGEL